MTDRIDHDGRMKTAEIPGEQNFIPRRFLREPKPPFEENQFHPEDNILKDYGNYEPINRKSIIPIELIEKKFISEFEKNIIPLNKINPSTLEGNNINRRLDRFIEEEMVREIPQRADRAPLPEPDPKKSFSSLTGLRVEVSRRLRYLESLTVKGEKVAFGDYSDIHFTPRGRTGFVSSKITESLVNGIQGLVELIDAVDQGRFEAAPGFVGTTNINMALIVQRLGFVIVDECRTPDGNINRNLSSFTVVGKLEDIKARVEEFKRAGVVQKLEQRNQRLKARPKLAPMGA